MNTNREIRILRELLGNMVEEQHAHLSNDAALLSRILQERKPLLIALSEEREKQQQSDIEQPERDQILALIEKITLQNERNNYLIQNKITQTKELIQRLHPANPHTTYGFDGNVNKQSAKTKVMVINREG